MTVTAQILAGVVAARATGGGRGREKVVLIRAIEEAVGGRRRL